ncbi:trehalose 6-phosphate phosphatase RA3 isoform X1 [Lolium perenne]|uniref:trehalose 6-phosphate phosphatase RA3 isoform X1 n=1 Tax=Lolium perenne TaxID=4522 RepID=UPI0021F63D0A|nr:trehalose 6-phosphate phosphatase RA3-like isoform X1 [Lolium perenne]
MTNHAAFAAEDAVTAVPPPAQAGRHFSSFPPRRARDCRKATLGRMDLAASGVLRGGSLLDSMKASSPRHAKFAAGADHEDWMEKHPSALEWIEAVVAAAKGKQIVMFLDYDGTLSPIVEDPDSAVMTEEMRDAVRSVAQHFPTAIVSGRSRDKVLNFVKLEELYYAGSHGMDIKGPTTVSNHKAKVSLADEVLCQPATEFLPIIQEVYETLTAKMEAIPGAMVENNKFCLSVHFRCVDEEEWDALGKEVRAVLEGYPDLRLTKGRKVLEIRPSIKWDKGNALEFLLESLGYAGRGDVFPIYIGDDRTDEDAFKVLRNMGQGIGILVTKFAKETTASYSLREPAEVKDFLGKLVMSTGTKG